MSSSAVGCRRPAGIVSDEHSDQTPSPVTAVVPTLSFQMLGLLGLALAAAALFVLRRL